MGLLQSSPFSIAEELQLHRCQSSAPYNSEFEHILMFFNFDLAYVMILSIRICDNCYFGRLLLSTTEWLPEDCFLCQIFERF